MDRHGMWWVNWLADYWDCLVGIPKPDQSIEMLCVHMNDAKLVRRMQLCDETGNLNPFCIEVGAAMSVSRLWKTGASVSADLSGQAGTQMQLCGWDWPLWVTLDPRGTVIDLQVASRSSIGKVSNEQVTFSLAEKEKR
jgi:hypothetical protein